MNPQKIAKALHEARVSGRVISPDSRLATIEQGYQVQAAIADLAQSPCIGFKLGATLDAAIQTLGLAASFHAPLFARDHYENDAKVPVSASQSTFVETEFVITVGADLAPGANVAAVRAATQSVRPGFELVATRFDMDLPTNGVSLVADAGGNAATVIGAEVSQDAWQSLDLAAHPASLMIDGVPRADGHSGQSNAGDPFAMVAWLLTCPALAERGLKQGELVYCGSVTGMLPVTGGNRLEADFGALGQVHATLVATDGMARSE